MNPADRYPAQVFWSDPDEGFIAIAADLPGCSAFGETKLEALDELQHAIAARQVTLFRGRLALSSKVGTAVGYFSECRRVCTRAQQKRLSATASV